MPRREEATPRSEGGTTVRLEACVDRLEAGDAAARDDLITFACNRMEQIARRMLKRFPNVRRWDETGDVVQNAAIRLYRSLAKVTPRDAKGFLGLAAVQIRRELIDLARKYAGPESHAANCETNFHRLDGEYRAKVDDAADLAETKEQLARWSALHEAAEKLPPEEKELFDLVWYMGLDQQEAANMLGCSVRTIKRRWDSVKQLMRQAAGEL
jgi:RNA polymerase sigma factor (sigma-70 family)